MRLLTLQQSGKYTAGLALGDGILDLPAAAAMFGISVPNSLKQILAGGELMLDRIRSIAARAMEDGRGTELRGIGALLNTDDVALGPVIPDPELILSGAMNSKGHNAEMNGTAPPHPIAFQKARSALLGSGRDIVAPARGGAMIDWEGEFCVVIGQFCHNVTTAEAGNYIGGFTLMNDVSAREFVQPYITGTTVAGITQAWDRLIAGKNYPTFCPIGPVIVTPDEFDGNYRMETWVNDECMQSSTADDLIFSVAECISYFSSFYRFSPGDIISMGSPPGVGMARNPPLYLKPGDRVEVREPHIGTLRNTFAAARSNTKETSI